jgi:hypothetical protein
MKLNNIFFSVGECLNFYLVYFSYGYLGNMHRAINFSFSNAALMLYIRPMLFYQASRRGISTKQLAFSNAGAKC